MDLLLTHQLLLDIARMYPGGARQFEADDGCVTMIPPPSLDVVICHPDLPFNMKAAFQRYAEDTVGQQVPHPVLQSVQNFDGFESKQITQKLLDLKDFLEEVYPQTSIDRSPSVLILGPSHMIHGSVIAMRIVEYLKNMEGLSLAYLLCDDIPHMVKGPAWKDDPMIQSVPEPTKRVISSDDITNLQIDLSQIENVDQLLEKLGGSSGK